MKLFKKKRCSIVRLTASCVPNFLWEYLIPIPPRMCISESFIEKISALKQNNLQLDDPNSSFSSFKSYFRSNLKKQQVLNSTPRRDEDVENAKLKALQKDLEEIKKQVAKLMEHQSEHLHYSDYGTLSNPNQSQKSIIPPPPPPPPPPLPNLPLSVNTPNKIEHKQRNLPPQKGFPCGKELLKDLKKVQLKKVEKSPGGGPVKKPKKVVNDPGDFLEAALKKRFGFVQNSPESSLESASMDNNSFDHGSRNNSYEVRNILKNTLT